MAAEIAAELRLNELIEAVQPEAVRPVLRKQLEYNANSARAEICARHDTLTGSPLSDQGWWSAYKETARGATPSFTVRHRSPPRRLDRAGLPAVQSLIDHLRH